MQRFGALVGLAAATLSSGCSLYWTGAYNLWNEPKYVFQEYRFARKARSLAIESWERRRTRVSASESFAEGYIDGYSDYLIAGQTTDPRPTPPKKYQKLAFQTPESLLAVEEYFAGFHAGAIDAEASGLRQRMVIPVVIPFSADLSSTWSSPPRSASPGTPESLPPPREIEPKEPSSGSKEPNEAKP